MVEDVIGVEPGNTYAQSVEAEILNLVSVNILAQIDVANLIVTTRAAIVQVDANLCCIKAEVELLFYFADVEVVDVNGIAKKYPPPTEIGSYLKRRCRGESHRLLVVTLRTESVDVVVVCAL